MLPSSGLHQQVLPVPPHHPLTKRNQCSQLNSSLQLWELRRAITLSGRRVVQLCPWKALPLLALSVLYLGFACLWYLLGLWSASLEVGGCAHQHDPSCALPATGFLRRKRGPDSLDGGGAECCCNGMWRVGEHHPRGRLQHRCWVLPVPQRPWV